MILRFCGNVSFAILYSTQGSIGREELGQLLDALGENLSEQEVDKMVSQVDKDGSGEIEFAEFLTMMHNKISGQDQIRVTPLSFSLPSTHT